MRNIKTVATNGNGKKPIVSDKLDAGDMVYFQNVLQAKAQAIEAAKAAQAVESFFWQTVSVKYGLEKSDNIAMDGTIIRQPFAEAVKTYFEPKK